MPPLSAQSLPLEQEQVLQILFLEIFYRHVGDVIPHQELGFHRKEFLLMLVDLNLQVIPFLNCFPSIFDHFQSGDVLRRIRFPDHGTPQCLMRTCHGLCRIHVGFQLFGARLFKRPGTDPLLC
jgi:hypothetical protein